MDLTLLIQFLKAMKAKVGNVVPSWIMSDDADQFYSAWYCVFGSGPQKLLCTWHVDRAWRGHLNSVKDRELAQTIYHNLRVLMEEQDKEQFEILLKHKHNCLVHPKQKNFPTISTHIMQTESNSGLFIIENILTSTLICT